MEVIDMLANKYGPDERLGLSKMIIEYACIRDLSLEDFDILTDDQKIALVDGMDSQFSGIFDTFYGLSVCYFTKWRANKKIFPVILKRGKILKKFLLMLIQSLEIVMFLLEQISL
jgi:hypothetical protein